MTEMVPKSRLLREKTARKEAEKLLEQKSLELFNKNTALEALTQNLEKLVEERTAELVFARDEAMAASKAKSAFLANMSHEIRTPLTAVIGFAENIQAGIISEAEIPSTIDIIIANSKHLLTLLNEILDISKIESGQLEIEQIRFALEPIIIDLDSIFQPICQAKGLYFDLNIDSTLPKDVTTDPTRVRQVLMNLIGNAVKFTENGKISLNVKADQEKQQLTFKVIDTGIGMSEEQINKLFNAFSQADNSVTRKYGGTGLGLTIAKELSALLNGDICVESHPGRGSTFTFTVGCEAFFDTSLNHMPNVESMAPNSLKGSVLVVEDNEVNQELIAQHLKYLGIDFAIEGNGELGFQAALAGEYDLILMDIQMSVMDGKEAVKILRSVGYNKPIYAVTANVMAQDITEYRQIGFNGHLGKPINKKHFYSILCKYLQVNTGDESYATEQFDYMAEARKKFFASLPGYKDTLLDACVNQNNDALNAILHQLKGLCGNFELKELDALAKQAYHLSEKGHSGAFARSEQLATMIDVTLTEFDNEKNG